MARKLRQVATDVFVRVFRRDFSDKEPLDWRMIASHVIAAKAEALKTYMDRGGSIPVDAYDTSVLDVTKDPNRYWQAAIPADFSDMEGGMYITLPGAGGDGKVSVIPASQVSIFTGTHSQGQIYAWRRGGLIEFADNPGPKVEFHYLATPAAGEMDEETEFNIPDFLLQAVMDMAVQRLMPASQKEDDKRATGNAGQRP